MPVSYTHLDVYKRQIRGIPTTWQGAAYAREHESISPLPMNKVDLLRSQIGMDWSTEIVEDATIDDLDEEAIKRARELFSKRQSDRKKAQEVLKKLSDIEVLNKAGITIKGKITRTALLLLGKSEAKYFFDGFIPRITWTLYNADNSVKAYEHFDIPMLMAVDKVYSRIRNVKYRYIAGQQTLFPDEVDQYEPELIKEIINNCIAHQDYRLRGKINVEEFEDRLVSVSYTHLNWVYNGKIIADLYDEGRGIFSNSNGTMYIEVTRDKSGKISSFQKVSKNRMQELFTEFNPETETFAEYNSEAKH